MFQFHAPFMFAPVQANQPGQLDLFGNENLVKGLLLVDEVDLIYLHTSRKTHCCG